MLCGVHCAPGPLCPPGVWSVSSDLVSTSGLPQVCPCHFWWVTLNSVLQHPRNSVSFSSSGAKLSFPLKSLPHVLRSWEKWEGFFRAGWYSLRFCGRATVTVSLAMAISQNLREAASFASVALQAVTGDTMLALKTGEWYTSFYPSKCHTKATRRVSSDYTHFSSLSRGCIICGKTWKIIPRGLMMPAWAWQESQREETRRLRSLR